MDAVAEVGEPAPEFSLQDLDGEQYQLQGARGQVVVLNFWSMECPWAEKGDEALAAMDVEWGRDALLWRIASNVNEPREQLRDVALERGLEPVLRDPDHQVADRYGAVTTPHVYVIDPDGVLRYKGAPNDATFKDPEPENNYLERALNAASHGRSPNPPETDGRGCTIVRHSMKSGVP